MLGGCVFDFFPSLPNSTIRAIRWPRKLHAVCVPYQAQGHINPMLKLAKLLHHNRLLRSRGPTALAGLPDFRFDTIPDGLYSSSDVTDATQDIPSLRHSTSTTCLAPFRRLLTRLNSPSSSSAVPPVTCIVSDGIMSFTLDAAEELSIFWTTSACGLYLPLIHSREVLRLLKNRAICRMDIWIPSSMGIDTDVKREKVEEMV